MGILLNDNDVALQAAPYRDKGTVVIVAASATSFTTAKNGGITTPNSVTLTATPNIVFTAAATYIWSYALNTTPTTWNPIPLSTSPESNTKTITSTTFINLIGTSLASSIQFRCAVSENFLDTAYGYVTVANSLEQANSDSVSIDLTRSSATINFNTANVATSFDNTGTTISVLRAGNKLVYNSSGGSLVAISTPNSFSVEIVTDTSIDSTVPNRTIGSISNTANTWSLSGITALTANLATVTFLITIYDASGNKSQTQTKILNLTKVTSGGPGDPATIYYIDVSAPVITKNTSSKFQSGIHAQITVYGKKISGATVYTTYGYLTITGDLETEATTATEATNAGLTTTIQNTSQNSYYTIKLYNMAARTNQTAILLDTQVIPVVFNGSNGITAILTNDKSTISVSAAGVPLLGSYTNTSTVIRVYEGSDELTYDTVGTTKGTFNVIASGIFITPGAISKITGTVFATAADASAITQDVAIINYNIQGTTKGGIAFTVGKAQSFNKSYNGTDAQLSFLQLSSPVITKDAVSAVVNGSHSIVTITGRQTIGNAVPTTTGFITFTPIRAVTKSGGSYITLSGAAGLAINDPIVFSGVQDTGSITIGTIYYITFASTALSLISISTTLGGTPMYLLSTTHTAMYAQSEAATATANSIVSSIPNDIGAVSFAAKMYSTANKTLLLDSAILPVIFKGASSITVVLSNDSVTIPFDSNNVVISGGYAGTPTEIRVFDGTVEITYNPLIQSGSLLENGTFRVTTTSSNITAGSIYVSPSGYAISAVASAMTNSVASITFTITGKSYTGAAINLTKVQSFAKSTNGSPGSTGTSFKIAMVTAFAWSLSTTPPALTGTFNYNWSTGAITAGSGMSTIYPTGWSAAAGSSTANKQTLHQITVTVTDVSTATITNNIAWNTGKAARIGYREDGSIGTLGDSARICYIVTTSVTPPATPISGVGDVMPTSSAGIWKPDPTPILAVGELMYQSDGTLTGGNITWRAPYLSNLKVGNLSAISANLGSITAGAININDRFIVNSSGQVKISGPGSAGRMEITNEAIKVFDSTGSLRVKLGNLDA